MSPAETYFKYRVTGFANSTLASNSWINCRMNGMLIGRVTTWMRFVRTSGVILIFPTITASSERRPPPPESPIGTGCGIPAFTPRTPGWPDVSAPFSKMSFSMSTTLLASARSSLMNSLTTSAGATSTCSITPASCRIMSAFCVTSRLEDFGSAKMLIVPELP